METSETDLERALRRLAIALADADELGANHDALVLGFGAKASPARDAELIEDALLAAGMLIAGSDPHLPLLAGVWGTAELRCVVEELAEELRRSL